MPSYTSGLMNQNFPQNLSQSTIKSYRMGGKVYVASLVTTFKVALATTAGKVKACQHLTQVSDVAIQVYPAL